MCGSWELDERTTSCTLVNTWKKGFIMDSTVRSLLSSCPSWSCFLASCFLSTFSPDGCKYGLLITEATALQHVPSTDPSRRAGRRLLLARMARYFHLQNESCAGDTRRSEDSCLAGENLAKDESHHCLFKGPFSMRASFCTDGLRLQPSSNDGIV